MTKTSKDKRRGTNPDTVNLPLFVKYSKLMTTRAVNSRNIDVTSHDRSGTRVDAIILHR